MMQPSRADHDDAIKAYAAIRASCHEVAEKGSHATCKTSLTRDLGALSTIVVAYTYQERISRSDYGEFLRVLARWLLTADNIVEV